MAINSRVHIFLWRDRTEVVIGVFGTSLSTREKNYTKEVGKRGRKAKTSPMAFWEPGFHCEQDACKALEELKEGV